MSLMSREHDAFSTIPKLALLNYLLSNISLLPARRDDENILFLESDLIRERHRLDVKYLVTKEQGMTDKCSEDENRAETKQRIEAVEAAIIDKCHCSVVVCAFH